jgi:tetratricopeptide (TPR) repeat protein
VSWTAGTEEPDLIELLDEALHALGDGDSPRRARLLGRLGMAVVFSDQYDRADGLSREAVAIARRLGDPVTLAFALGERCHAIWGPDNPEERLELTGEILELARQAGKPRREMWARLWRLVALLELVRVEEADRELDRFAELAGGLRLASALFHVVAARVVRATLDGRFDEAERLAYQGIAQQWQSRNAEQDFAIQMFVIRRDLGRRAELEDTAVTLRALAMQYPGFRFLYRSMLAASTLEIGRHDEARRTLDELAAHDFADAHREFSWMTVMSLLGEVASDLGDVRRAAILYDLLTPYAARFPVLGWVGMALGSVSYPLGLLAATLGRTAAAVRHFEDALAMNRKVGARPYVIRTELAYGRLLAAGGEQARARALLDRAAAGAAELGMAGLVERAKVSLQSC